MTLVTTDLHTAIRTVQQGGVLAYPTEAVFGLGCHPANPIAIQRILAIKQRPAYKGLILIAAELVQLKPWLLPLDDKIRARILPTWPGPFTWILPAHPDVSPLIRGNHNTLAVRVTSHPTCRALCQQLGHPLISTSANLNGHLPAHNTQEVLEQLDSQVDCILDAPLGAQNHPTEIRDGLSGKIIRAG